MPLYTNADVVKIIASYMSPNPVELVRLAMVNKDFYSVFTSDDKWKAFDAYARKKNIFRHFMGIISSYEQLMVLCWAAKVPDFPRLAVEKLDNKYVQLGYYKKLLRQKKAVIYPRIYDKVLVNLLIASGGFQYASPEIQDNEAIALRACSLKSSNLEFISDRLVTPHFYSSLIDHTVSGGAIPPVKIKQKIMVNKEIILYAWRANEAILTYWLSLNQTICAVARMVKEMNFNKGQLAEFVVGAPQVLDEYPEHWHDHEFCLSAFSAKKYNQHSLPTHYLAQCTDTEVVAMALQNFPRALYFVSEEFRRDKDMAMLAICSSSNCNVLARTDWAYHADASTQLPWTDSEFVAQMVDNGYWHVAHKYSFNKLTKSCNDLEWVKQRLENQPWIWNEISIRLRKDRTLLMLALDSKKKIMRMPVAERGNRSADFSIHSLPVQFQEDEELLTRAAQADALGNISPNDVNEAMIRAQLIVSFSGERLVAAK